MNELIFKELKTGRISSVLQKKDGLQDFLPLLANIFSTIRGPNTVLLLQTLQCLEGADILQKFLQSDFADLHQTALKEQKLRQKSCSRKEDSILVMDSLKSFDVLFEEGGVETKLRVVASELLFLLSKHSSQVKEVCSTLFVCEDQHRVLSYAINVLCYKLPALFNVMELCEMFLKFPEYGSIFVRSMTLNNPVKFEEILLRLVDLYIGNKEEPYDEVCIN